MEQKQTHLIYGLITGILTAITGIIIYMSGKAFVPGMQYLQDVPFLVGIILNGIAFSKANNGYVTFGNVFWSCFKATMIITLILVISTVLHVVMTPDMKGKALAAAHDEMVKQGYSDDKIDMSIKMMTNNYVTILISGVLLGTLVIGAIFSLIGGAAAKKKGAAPLSADNF